VISCRAIAELLNLLAPCDILLWSLNAEFVSQSIDGTRDIAVVVELCGEVDNIATVARAEVVPAVALDIE
jgi:hypothetical protein